MIAVDAEQAKLGPEFRVGCNRASKYKISGPAMFGLDQSKNKTNRKLQLALRIATTNHSIPTYVRTEEAKKQLSASDDKFKSFQNLFN